MNDVFREFLEKFVMCYLDNILIYSKKIEHKEYVNSMLQKLQDAGLYAKLENCVFHQPQVEFLGYIISNEGLSMDQNKIQTITNWLIFQTVHDV